MNKRALIIIFVLLVIVGITFSSPVSAENITILSSSGWIDSTEHYRIVGEVQNADSTTARDVRLSITLYDSKNITLENWIADIKLVALPPGTKSPFSTVSFGFDSNYQSYDVHQVDHYDIKIHSVNWLPAQEGRQISPNGLQILSYRTFTDSKGYLNVDGEIQNIGAVTSNYTYIFVTLYDSNGKVVDFMQDTSQPENIGSGEIASFGMTYHAYFYPTRPPLIASYSLTAESNIYGLNSTNLPQSPILIEISPTPSVQEFPSWIIPPALLVLAALVVAAIKRKAKI